MSTARKGCIVTALLGTALFVALISRETAFLTAQMNPDNLWIPAFAWDVHRDGVAAAIHFRLARVPNFFPDVLFFMGTEFAGISFRWGLYLYALMKFFSLCLLGGAFVRVLSGQSYRSCAVCVGSLTAGMLLIESLDYRLGINADLVARMQDHCSLYCDLLVPGEHGGAFLPAACVIYAACVFMERRLPIGKALLIAFLVFAAIVSDRMTLVSCMIPVLAALLTLLAFAGAKKEHVLSIAAAIAGGVGAGFLVDSRLNHDLSAHPQAWQIQAFLEQTAQYAAAHPLASAETCALIVVFLLSGVRIWKSIREYRRSGLNGENMRRIAFVWFVVLLGLLGSLSIFLDLYVDFASYRYLAPMRFLLLVFPAAALARLRVRPLLAQALAASALLATIGTAFKERTVLPGSTTWTMPDAACVEKTAIQYGAGAGIAEYWSSLPLMLSLNQSLQIFQTLNDGTPYIHQNDPSWYARSFSDPARTPEFRFVYTRLLYGDAALSLYGKPDRIEHCSLADVWIYDDPHHLFERMRERGFYVK